MVKMVRLFNTINTLEGIHRYSRDDLEKPESLMSHLGWCATAGFILASEIKNDLKINIDVNSVVARAIIHDFDEAGTGDIVRNVKYASPAITTNLKGLEHDSVRYFESYLGLSKGSIYDKWLVAKDHSIEGTLVKLIDILAVGYKVYEEVYLLNNRQFLRVTREFKELLDSDFIETTIDSIESNEEFDRKVLKEYLMKIFSDAQTAINKLLENAQLTSIESIDDDFNFLQQKK